MLYHGPVSVEAFFLYGPRSYEASYIAYLKQMISFGPFFTELVSVKIAPDLRWSFIELIAGSKPLRGVEIKTKSAFSTASFALFGLVWLHYEILSIS